MLSHGPWAGLLTNSETGEYQRFLRVSGKFNLRYTPREAYIGRYPP